MFSVRTPGMLGAARAEALFASDLSAGERHTPEQVTAAITTAIRRNGGTRGCAAVMASAYGDRPELAAPRMRWARATVATVYRPTGR